MALNRKKNIGILFPCSKKGGVFQYALSIIDGLSSFSNDFNYFVLYYDTENPKDFLKNKNFQNIQFVCLDSSSNSFFGRAKLLSNALLGKSIFTTNKKNKELLEKISLDLLISPIPCLLAFENRIPFIVSVVDTMHKYYPKFPEYSFSQRLKRDIIYKSSAKHSILTIVDSQQGIEDLYKFYKILKEKIKVIPYIPPGYIFKNKDVDESILDKYKLGKKFLFYPAQFWYHKNHIRLVKAIKLIKEKKGAKLQLVLVGDSNADKDNYQKVMDLAKGLDVKHLGYVSNKEMVALYKKSFALVFTSLGGPTNIPPLEAMILGTPVLCSNLFEMPKQVGDAGLLFDPFNIEDMAEKIYKIWTDEQLGAKLIKNGYNKTKELSLKNYSKQWEKVIIQALNYGE